MKGWQATSGVLGDRRTTLSSVDTSPSEKSGLLGLPGGASQPHSSADGWGWAEQKKGGYQDQPEESVSSPPPPPQRVRFREQKTARRTGEEDGWNTLDPGEVNCALSTEQQEGKTGAASRSKKAKDKSPKSSSSSKKGAGAKKTASGKKGSSGDDLMSFDEKEDWNSGWDDAAWDILKK